MLRKLCNYSALSVVLALSLVSCGVGEESDNMLPSIRKALSDSTSVFYGNFGSYPENISVLPIGIFDCNVSGFEVVEKILTLDRFDNITGKAVPDGIADFAGEDIQFLSDRANGPYGRYISAGNMDYLKELIVQNAVKMMGWECYNLASDEYMSGFKEPVKLLVVSSPVADIHGLSEINSLLSLSGTGVKAVGVIESGIREAVSAADEEGNLCVGVLFAPEGISSYEYESIIRRMAEEEGVSGKVQVFNQEAVGLDAAIKGDTAYFDPSATSSRNSYAGPVTGISYNNIDLSLFDRYGFETDGNALLYSKGRQLSGVQLNSIENYVRFHLVSMVERHRRSGGNIPLSSIILADGSYSQVKDIMEKVMHELYNYRRGGIFLYRSTISPDFKFIDPAECAAVEAYSILRKDGHLALRGEKSRLVPFITLPSGNLPQDVLNPDGSLKDEYKYGRESGTEEITTKMVPFAPRYVSPSVMNYIEKNNPATYSLIRNSLY